MLPPVLQTPAKCGTGSTTWYSTTEKMCFNGFAQDVTFTFDGSTTLPDNVRYAITYGTSNYGSTRSVPTPAPRLRPVASRTAERRLH